MPTADKVSVENTYYPRLTVVEVVCVQEALFAAQQRPSL